MYGTYGVQARLWPDSRMLLPIKLCCTVLYSHVCAHMQVLVHGHNGLLPKLDLYYLLRYFFHFHIPVQAGLWQEADAAGLHAAASKLAWDQVGAGCHL